MKPNSAPRMHVVRRPLCQEKGKQFKILPLPDDLVTQSRNKQSKGITKKSTIQTNIQYLNMSVKRQNNFSLSKQHKRRRSDDTLTYFQKTLQDAGLTLKAPPEKCQISSETVYIVRDLRKILKSHEDYPQNIAKFLTEFENTCKDKKIFEHYLFLNVVKLTSDSKKIQTYDSLIKTLLNVTFLQDKLVDFIFHKVKNHLDTPEFASWMKMILQSLSTLDTLECSEKVSNELIDLLDISSDKMVRLEIILAIPNIIGDQEHNNVADQMSRILSDEPSLIPAILDCLSYLCLSDEQFQRLQKQALEVIQPSNAAYFTNFVKFLLTPGRLSDSAYEDTIKDLRRVLQWSSFVGSEQDIASSQVLTARAIRNSMLSSRAIANAWLKVISSCQINTDHKPIDIVFFLILYSVSDEKQKQVENVMRKQIKLQILREDLVNNAFNKFKPIFSDNLVNLITLTNTLLNSNSEHLVQTFASHMYMVMFSELTECRQIIVAELLQIVSDSQQSKLNALNILNNIASENMSLLKGQSQKILTLFDRLDDMTLAEIRAVMNLVCGFAYSFENSDIRDDVYIIIRKELGSSIPSIKLQGILAGIHSVKYLAKVDSVNNSKLPDDITLNMTSVLPNGNLREAGEIIRQIDCSTRHFPDMIAFFYDELYKIIQQEKTLNKYFISWLAKALTNDLQEYFLVDSIEQNPCGEIELSMQLCLNEDSEVFQAFAINIAGLILGDNREVNIEILSPLFQLVRILHYRKTDGNLSSIDALLGCPIVMPTVDIDTVENLSESTITRILDCTVHCVNWIRELLNAFAAQSDEVLKPKILNRILHLRQLEKNIEQILLRKDMTYKSPSYYSHALNIYNVSERRPLKAQNAKQKKEKKPELDDTALPASSRTQPSQIVTSIKNRLATIHNIHFRPLNLTLIQLLKYNLSTPDALESEMTIDIMNYLLTHLNGNLEKILVPRIKRKTFLNKNDVEIYNRSEAETQAKIICEILPKVMEHVELIVSFLERNIVEENKVDIESLFLSNIVESSLCLEQIYNLLTIYFGWIEFKSDHVVYDVRSYQALLLSSLRKVAKIDDELTPMEDLIKTIMDNFEKHEKYCITLSSAVSLIELMKTLQEHSTGSNAPLILKNMTYKFLSKQWKTPDDQLERGLVYNQGIDSLTKVYLANNKLEELKGFVTELENDVENLRDKTSVMKKMPSITKSNFSLLLRNLTTTLCDKIKPHLSGGLTNEHLEMWKTVATILELMSNMVKVHNNKNTSSAFLRKSHPILNLFLSKGYPILKIQIKDSRQLVLDVLKGFQPWIKWLQTTCSQSEGKLLMKKIPIVKGALTDLMCKTEDLLESNDCLAALGQFLKAFKVTEEEVSRKKSKKDRRSIVHNVNLTVEDCDEDLPEEDSDNSIDTFQGDSAGISEMM